MNAGDEIKIIIQKSINLQVILASSSPRRSELLTGLGIPFTIDVSEVDESVPGEKSPAKIVEILAIRKASAVARKYSAGLIIGADTIVVLDKIILGKPKDEDDALAMILQLQGREHQVYSGVAIIDAATGKRICGHAVTNVEFRNISEDEAKRYIATGEPQGKAGSYAIQGLGAIFIKGLRGDYFNVVGLPLYLVSELLHEFNVNVL